MFIMDVRNKAHIVTENPLAMIERVSVINSQGRQRVRAFIRLKILKYRCCSRTPVVQSYLRPAPTAGLGVGVEG